MNKFEQAVHDGKLAVANMRSKIQGLASEVSELEIQLEHKRELLQELMGSGWQPGSGELNRLKRELVKANRELAHSKAPKVVWQERPFSKGDYVVTRVTPKRIYVSMAGSRCESIYGHDGSPNGSWKGSKIDIEKTFPGGVECTKK